MKSMFELHGVRAVNMSQMHPSDWDQALEDAEASMRMGLRAIVSAPIFTTFDSTLGALERIEQPLSLVWGAFSCVEGAHSTPELQNLSTKWAPRLSALNSEIHQNEELLLRCKHAYFLEGNTWTRVQQRVWEKSQRAFKNAGCGLDEQSKARVKQLTIELSSLDTEFDQLNLANANVTIPVAKSKLVTADPALLEGLAEENINGEDIVRIPVTSPYVEPLLTQLPDQATRKVLHQAWTHRGTGQTPGDQSTKDLINKILKTRFDLAQTLGYESWADYVLSDKMAQNPQKVRDMLTNSWNQLVSATQNDLQMVQDFAHDLGHVGPLEAWDVEYFTEKLRAERFNVDESTVKEYFPHHHVRQKAFEAAGKVFGVQFEHDPEIPVYHPSVVPYKVSKNGQALGILMIDDTVRPTKGPGAWMNVFASAHQLDGAHNAGVINVLNLPTPNPDKPTLLTQNEVTTIYHELGHALHGLLGNTPHPSQSGTNVSRDFVELPSQIFENWAQSPEALKELSHHFITGEHMPDELFEQMQQAKKFGQTFFKTAYLQSSLVDLELHANPPPVDPFAMEQSQIASMNAPTSIPPRHHVPHFGHIFGGGYSSGYYSYLWAEVLEADAFARFKENGLYDPQTCKDLSALFEAGDSVDAMDLFVAFRSREPDPSALLERWGVSKAKKTKAPA